MKTAENLSLIYDLHSHTTCSDGSLSPEELITRADVRHIDFLAITDHDTTAALEQAKVYRDKIESKLKLINGIEISTKWHGFEIHIVGLCIDAGETAFQEVMSLQRKNRQIRAQNIALKLEKKGVKKPLERATELAKGPVISRTHYAKVLLEQGFVSNFEQAFKKYLGKGKSCYVSPNWMDIETAVKFIKLAGGIAVLAHPIRYDLSNKWLTKLVDEFAAVGGEGLEVGLTQMSPNQRTHLSRLATERGLYSSQGSDFHAPARWLDLGKNLRLTDACVPIWRHPRWRFS